MKQGNLEKWSDCISCENLLFFSELVNELLFDYSIPSNRVATLNTHFLCIDAMSAINAIENNGVPEGTLKPIVEELFTALKDLDFNGKIVRPFVTHEGSGLSGVPRQLKEICTGAEVLDGLAITGSEVNNSKVVVENWI